MPRRIDAPWSVSQDENENERLSETYPSEDYPWAFHQNETTWRDEGKKTTSSFYLAHTPVVPGTTIGTIYLGQSRVEHQIFVIATNGEFKPTTLNGVGKPNLNISPRCTNGILNHVIGELVLVWDVPPGPHHVVFSYESVTEILYDENFNGVKKNGQSTKT